MRYQRTLRGTAIFEGQKHGRASANTLPTESKYGITYSSACTHDSNEIPTATEIFKKKAFAAPAMFEGNNKRFLYRFVLGLSARLRDTD